MTDVPTTEELAAQLSETTREIASYRSELAEFRSLAEQAQARPEFDVEQFAYDEPELVAAQPTIRPVLPPLVRQTPLVNQQELAAQGIALAAQAVPDWHTYGQKVVERITENPTALAPAFQSGDVGAVAQSLAGVYASVKQSDSNRSMKLAAQTASGASGRTEAIAGDAAEWAAIKAATPAKYWQPAS